MGTTYANYILERTADEWAALIHDQRYSWFEFAMDHPVTYWHGSIKTLNGWQMFNYVNCMLAVAKYSFLILDPPHNLTLPDPIQLEFTTWNVKSKLPSGETRRHGRLLTNIETPIPVDRVIIFYQFWEHGRKPNWTPPSWAVGIRTRNQRKYRAGVLYPGFSGAFDLATYGGMTLARRWHTDNIQGNWVRCNPRKRKGLYRVVSTINGMYTQVPMNM